MTKPTGHSDTLTRGIRVRVGAQLVPSQSKPERRRWMYTYRVLVRNDGEETVQLLSRHWVILDADNDCQEVRGTGVVGQQPVLEPGESFSYMSGCPLPTEWGSMEGSYTMRTAAGETFEAEIGRFFLAPTTAPIPAA
ncbi:MAG TPA: Co2+/Mg2+ efflux protein ApaG [Planctomycetota bacterium]